MTLTLGSELRTEGFPVLRRADAEITRFILLVSESLIHLPQGTGQCGLSKREQFYSPAE